MHDDQSKTTPRPSAHEREIAYQATIAGLRGGFMRMLQADNQCARTGRACREDGCGCWLEMGQWVNEHADTMA
jgi:hypothetical protein